MHRLIATYHSKEYAEMKADKKRAKGRNVTIKRVLIKKGKDMYNGKNLYRYKLYDHGKKKTK